MNERRAQGRPGRGVDEVGKIKIVDGTRAFLRQGARELTRKDIAEFIGITPALVSYYFPERIGLIEAATCPIIADYADHIRSIVDIPGPPDLRIRALVESLVDLHTKDGPLFDCFLAYILASEGYSGQDYFQDIISNIALICSNCIGDAEPDAKSTTIALAIWGACKGAAQKPSILGVPDINPAAETTRRVQAGYVADLLVSGIAGLSPRSLEPVP